MGAQLATVRGVRVDGCSEQMFEHLFLQPPENIPPLNPSSGIFLHFPEDIIRKMFCGLVLFLCVVLKKKNQLSQQ